MPTSESSRSDESAMTSSTSRVWSHHVPVPGTPEGFTMRSTFPGNVDGVEVMLEQWEAGTAEPPHAHPGDDMTVVVEGRMTIQFFKKTADGADGANELIADGDLVILNKGDVGYVKAGRIHEAKYVEPCKLVYVHDKAFGFEPHT